MASVAVTNTFTANTTASASEVNTNFTDLVNYVNNRNSGSTTWDALRVTTSSAVVAVLNNSTGTDNILNCQDNGTNVFVVADGGATTVTATAGGSSVALTVNNSTSTGNILTLSDNGTAMHTFADGGGVVFNENGNNADLRIEGDTEQNLVFCDASADAIGVGTNSPSSRFHLQTSSNGTNTQHESSRWVATTSQDMANGFGGSLLFGIRDSAGTDNPVCAINWIRANGVDNSGDLSFVTYSAGSNVYRMNIFYDGGVTINEIAGSAPTGGSKGAGSLNVAGDIYKNNTAYTNPDYVMEWWATGKIEKYMNNPGASTYSGPYQNIDDLMNYCLVHHDLPRVKSAQKDEDGGQGIFARADTVLEKIEEAYIYIFQLHERLKHLEAK